MSSAKMTYAEWQEHYKTLDPAAQEEFQEAQYTAWQKYYAVFQAANAAYDSAVAAAGKNLDEIRMAEQARQERMEPAIRAYQDATPYIIL